MIDTSKALQAAKNKNRIPWLGLAIGFVFILNPNITVVDFLPDFIGYIIISLSLRKLALIGETLADAKKAFEKMILIDAGKTLAIFWVFGIEAVSERATSLLLWSFVFGVLEGIFLIPCYLKLFKGLSALGNYHPNSSIHLNFGKTKKSITDAMMIFSIAFVILKAVLTVLPELSDLTSISAFESGATVSLYRYIGIMRMLACIPVAVIGLVWYANIVRYFRKIANDTELNNSLNVYYEENVLPRKGLFVIRNVKIASWLFVIAAILTLDLTLDGVTLLPDVLVLPVLIAAFVYIGKFSSLKKTLVYVLGALYGVLSVASYALNYAFHELYSYNAMDRDFSAFLLYFAGVLAVALQGIVFICLLSAIFKQIHTVVAEHTGYVLGKENASDGENRRIAEFHKEINKTFSLALDFAVLYVISDVAYALYGAIYAFLRNNAGYLGMVNIIFGLVFIGMTVRAFDTLKDAVQTKYMLE